MILLVTVVCILALYVDIMSFKISVVSVALSLFCCKNLVLINLRAVKPGLSLSGFAFNAPRLPIISFVACTFI